MAILYSGPEHRPYFVPDSAVRNAPQVMHHVGAVRVISDQTRKDGK
jgi:hypothetical protein